ncbi:MAG: 30S ribosomal protein S1 [Candidatus Acidoferrales bacterium]|nr:30S ribosomal protein S1 [Candidatus Acidoferrales bacterium]
MSPEHDNNPQPSAIETVQAETEPVNVAPEPAATIAPQQSAAGAATAVVRAPETPQPAPPAAGAETNSISSEPDIAIAGSETAGTETLSTAETAAPTAEAAPATSAPASDESAESETTETMDQLLDQFSTPPAASEGEIFDGRVLAVTDAGVVVDVGGKFEGLVPAQEFLDSGEPIEFGEGQTIEVERLHERKDGYVLLSYVRAHRRRVWERIEKSYREHTNVTGKIAERIKGGLVVNIGVRAFLPASQIELRPVHDLESWKDREIEVRVLKLNRKRGNVVVSRRAILEDEQKAMRDALAGTLVEGAVVTGRVKNVTDYGIFVDLGGMDGLLHVSDLAWGRAPHPTSIVKPGEEIQVQILKFDKEKQRISLGRKQLLPDPWAAVPERFPAGTRVHGKVVGVTDYGVFVQIEPGVEGLVHVSEMSWSKHVKHPSKIVKTDDEVDVVVLEVKTDQRRISLGMKQLLPDPWEAAAQRYPVGAIVNGRVRNLAEFGAFVELEEGMEGLIHISDVSWTERIKHPSEKFKKGETVEAKVLKVDSQNRRLSLGIKQMNDIWANWFKDHKLGDILKGKVARTTDFGAFVELAEGIEGLCHVSEIEERRPKGEREKSKAPRDARITAVLTAGQEYDFKILRLEPEQRKISLSYRAAQKQVEREEIKSFRTTKSSPTATIGDAVRAKLQSS